MQKQQLGKFPALYRYSLHPQTFNYFYITLHDIFWSKKKDNYFYKIYQNIKQSISNKEANVNTVVMGIARFHPREIR